MQRYESLKLNIFLLDSQQSWQVRILLNQQVPPKAFALHRLNGTRCFLKWRAVTMIITAFLGHHFAVA